MKNTPNFPTLTIKDISKMTGAEVWQHNYATHRGYNSHAHMCNVKYNIT